MFSKILIANRGEIACRVMRTARAMGVKSVAVYSDADGENGIPLHVREADEAVPIGPRDEKTGREPYLIAERILNAAVSTGAEAIHPGYGFLSENPEFVEEVEAAGLVFIGPSASSIRAMGLKDAAKKLMHEAGVPVVPGYHGDNQDPDYLAKEAKKIGYPVLIKARAGGGGKGMRLVEKAADFSSALEGAQREGEASFNDGHVLIEKFITSPRHIEIQVFGDSHGNAVHLFERDCSLQRRHQKVIEEAPAPGMTDDMRNAMGEAAVRAAKAIDYCGAGTIEFIVDGSDGLHPDKFWFMEMNTRLQVEHPVTEAITGQDLVEWQLRVANGEQLPLAQNDLSISGHAIEARLYAENVPKGFLPSTGTLHHLKFSPNARNDSAVTAGDTITPYYDPMIAKVIVHGDNREHAFGLMQTALAETQVAGSVTNLAFLAALMDHEGFAEGELDTGLIARDLDQLAHTEPPSFTEIAAAALAASGVLEPASGADPFDRFRNYVHWSAAPRTQSLVLDGETTKVKIQNAAKDDWSVTVGDETKQITVLQTADDRLKLSCGDETFSSCLFKGPDYVALFAERQTVTFQLPDPLSGADAAAASGDIVVSPMPGLVKKTFCEEGSDVEAGARLIVLEAMKMEHTLTAPRDGRIAKLNVATGDQVEDGAVLVALEPIDA